MNTSFIYQHTHLRISNVQNFSHDSLLDTTSSTPLFVLGFLDNILHFYSLQLLNDPHQKNLLLISYFREPVKNILSNINKQYTHRIPFLIV